MGMDDDYIQAAIVSEMTGLSVRTLGQLRYTGGGPKYYKPTHKTILYKRSDVVAWIEASAHERTSTPSFA
jgi:hypothetical protein